MLANDLPDLFVDAARILVGLSVLSFALLMPACFLASPHRLRFRRRVEAEVLLATWSSVSLFLGSLGLSILVAQRYVAVSVVFSLYSLVPLIDVVSLYRRWHRYRERQSHRRRPPSRETLGITHRD